MEKSCRRVSVAAIAGGHIAKQAKTLILVQNTLTDIWKHSIHLLPGKRKAKVFHQMCLIH